MLQNELNTDVARFTSHVRTCLATNKVARFVFLGRKTRSASIAIQLVLQQCSKKSCTFLVAFFTVPLTAQQPRLEENENENVNEDKNDDENENEDANEG